MTDLNWSWVNDQVRSGHMVLYLSVVWLELSQLQSGSSWSVFLGFVQQVEAGGPLRQVLLFGEGVDGGGRFPQLTLRRGVARLEERQQQILQQKLFSSSNTSLQCSTSRSTSAVCSIWWYSSVCCSVEPNGFCECSIKFSSELSLKFLSTCRDTHRCGQRAETDEHKLQRIRHSYM